MEVWMSVSCRVVTGCAGQGAKAPQLVGFKIFAPPLRPKTLGQMTVKASSSGLFFGADPAERPAVTGSLPHSV